MSAPANEPSLLLLAAGGHGRVVLDAALAGGLRLRGILDPGLPVGDTLFGVAVLGGDDWLKGREPGGVLLANGAGATRRGAGLRRRFFEQWKAQGFYFATVVHPSAVLGRGAALGEGSQVMAGAIVQPQARIGLNAVLNTRASVDHDCLVADHAFVGPGAVLCGGVRVGEDAFIGAGAVLLPGVAVGRGAVVGAGALVNRDVPDGTVVAGNPATPRTAREG